MAATEGIRPRAAFTTDPDRETISRSKAAAHLRTSGCSLAYLSQGKNYSAFGRLHFLKILSLAAIRPLPRFAEPSTVQG